MWHIPITQLNRKRKKKQLFFPTNISCGRLSNTSIFPLVRRSCFYIYSIFSTELPFIVSFSASLSLLHYLLFFLFGLLPMTWVLFNNKYRDSIMFAAHLSTIFLRPLSFCKKKALLFVFVWQCFSMWTCDEDVVANFRKYLINGTNYFFFSAPLYLCMLCMTI